MDRSRSADPRHRLGASAEDRAAEYLVAHGYRIVERNATNRLGEIDLVAEDGEVLVFVEVRSRSHPDQVHPAATVTRKKQQQIVRTALAWCALHRVRDRMLRFDVVAVLGPEGAIELYQNAFEAGR
ncbi:MAG TPA: YraN family protein [Myxococcota bacterium]|nr:YraN family protein [Myxococcota bacterium]HRY93850.1 YraN family protein [Myxococcota bacterium]